MRQVSQKQIILLSQHNKAKIIKMVLAQGFVLGDEGILDSYKGQHVLFLELGVGAKTPVKIKYPFWEMTEENENAVYDSYGVVVNGCRFDGPADGESALKESRNIVACDSYFNLRYPFWHDAGVEITDCEMTDKCRAALWYSNDIRISATKLFGIKALRECRNVIMEDCDIISSEFGWTVDERLGGTC